MISGSEVVKKSRAPQAVMHRSFRQNDGKQNGYELELNRTTVEHEAMGNSAECLRQGIKGRKHAIVRE